MEIKIEALKNEQLSKNLIIAREASGKSIKEVCNLLAIPTSKLKNYEKGKYTPSLPELETISFLYRIPLQALIGEWNIEDYYHLPNTDQLQNLIKIRQEIISTHLLLAREKNDISYKDLSQKTGISTARIKRYEKEESPPFDELVKLCEVLEIKFSDLIDKDSPLGSWQEKHCIYKKMEEIPEDMISFFLEPSNLSRLELAKQISGIGLDQIAQLTNALSNTLGEFLKEDDKLNKS